MIINIGNCMGSLMRWREKKLFGYYKVYKKENNENYNEK